MMRIVLLFLFSLMACSSEKKVVVNQQYVSQHIILYKTKHDYNKNVAILLSDDKSMIVSYPHPNDVIVNGRLCEPIIIENGYLLDCRGINQNVAFLSVHYEEYSKLKEPLSLDDMKKKIIDSNPVLEMYDCGRKTDFRDVIKELNACVKQNDLKRFKRLK